MNSQSTLIILPGWGGSHETWADFVSYAKDFFADVSVIDLPCFGDEPCPNSVWGVKEYAEFVEKKLSTNQYKNVILLGHSFGGVVATYLVAHNHGAVEKLVLSGSPIYRKRNGLRWYFFLILAKIGKQVFRLPFIHSFESIGKKVLYKVADSPDYNKTSGIQRQIFQKITKEDMSHLLTTIQTPTLVMWGELDSYVPLNQGKRIAKKIPHCTCIVVKNGKHGLHLTHKELLVEKIIAFST